MPTQEAYEHMALNAAADDLPAPVAVSVEETPPEPTPTQEPEASAE